MDSEGLLILTNDGDLAQRLTHPSHEVEKEYLAMVAGQPDEEALRKLRRGVVIEGRRTAPALADPARPPAGVETPAGHSWLRVVIKEGRKRQVRRMCEEVGHPVARLVRTRIGPLRLRGLVPGRVRELTPTEIERLREAAGLPTSQKAEASPSSGEAAAPQGRRSEARAVPARGRSRRPGPRAARHP
jgi:23S rRNA pseudouridine2605 synthase